MARGDRARIDGGSIERWLAATFGTVHGAEIGLAPFALLGEGRVPGEHGWMRADPVHLRIHADRVFLADPSRLAITVDEARQLVDALNAHFSEQGIELFAPHPERWYARVASAPRLQTTPTAEVAGQDIEGYLPKGAEQTRWRSVFNEAQMVMHEHTCNRQREQSGKLPVNSLWFWGAGRNSPPGKGVPYRAVWSDDPSARGLALASGVAAHPLPHAAPEFIGSARLITSSPDSPHLVVLPPLPGVAYGDTGSWAEALLQYERNWFAPLLAGMHEGVLSSVTLHALGPAGGWRVSFTRADRLKFWRRGRRLFEYST